MPFPPIKKSLEGLLQDVTIRLGLVERRLGVVPGRLTATGEEVTDWDLAVASGFYFSQLGALNAPINDHLVGTVKVVGTGAVAGRIVQEVSLPTVGTPILRTWRRTYNAGGFVWGVWIEVLRMPMAADLTPIPAGTNLNDILESGLFLQGTSANATLALNYPVASAGHLSVSYSTTGADFVLQTYTQYLNQNAWSRTFYNGSWQDWKPAGSVRGQVDGLKIASGSISVAALAMDAAAIQTVVSFPAGFFSSAPVTWFAIAANGRLTCSIASVTASTMTVSVNNWSAANAPATSVQWTAIGVGP